MRSLLEWVLDRFPHTPRKRAKQWIAAGRVRVGTEVIRRPDRIMPDPGGALELLDRSATGATIVDEERRIHPRLTLMYMDSSLAVVNKSAGLLSVASGSRNETSVLRIFRDFLKGGSSPRGRAAGLSLPPGFRSRTPLPVHRIDQYTSGLLCIAMNPAARKILIEEFSAHRVVRQYVAYVDGRPSSPSGTWRHRLRLEDDGYRQTVDADPGSRASGKNVMEAITEYEVLEEFAWRGRQITKLRLNLFTGCKHQIRIQAAQEGLPIIGDRTYHPRYSKAHEGSSVPVEIPRQALHAERLELTHPEQSGKRLTWTAPLPDDLMRLESVLRRKFQP